MLNMNLQLFAHKKGVGSTKNGRDSEALRLAIFCTDSAALTSIRVRMSDVAATTHCTLRLTVLSVSQDSAKLASSAP